MEEKPYGVIYLLIDCTNDLEYVGQTVQTFEKRFRRHLRGNQYIDRVIRKRGTDMIATAILKVCHSKAELDYYERHFIKYRDTMKPNGYNLTEGGGGTVGYKLTPEQIAKMVAANSGENHPLFGQSLPAETCSKISIKNRADSPYPNLIAEIDAHHLSFTALAKLMGFTSHKSIAPKIAGKQGFTEHDKVKLVEIFDKPIEYLLARDDATICEEIPAVRLKSPFKNLLRELEARQISCSQLAELLERAYSTVVKKMRGNANFTDSDKVKLVEIFGKPIEYLLERDDGATCEKTPAPRKKRKRTPEQCEKTPAPRRKKTPYKNLLRELDARQISYHQLAELLGSSYSTVSKKMRGNRDFTDSDEAKLPKIFGKPIDYLLERDDGISCDKEQKRISDHRARLSRAARVDTPYKNLLRELDAHELSYRQLAELLGLSKSNISEKMSGKHNFTKRDKVKLVEIFGKPIEYLLERFD